MPISEKHNAVFIHIPKTGGQSVSSMLGISKSRANYYSDELTHMTVGMLDKVIDLTGKYIFTFVRNPYDKILSEYSWRMRNRTSAIFNEPTKDLITFDQYMETLLDRWDGMQDAEWRTRAHVMPQHMYIDNRVDMYRHELFTTQSGSSSSVSYIISSY